MQNFAKDLMKRLDKEGIPYKKVELKAIDRPRVNIWSDKMGQNISTNVYHIGVKVGDKVYDNNHPFDKRGRQEGSDVEYPPFIIFDK